MLNSYFNYYNYNRDLLCAPYKQNDGTLQCHCHEVLTIKAVLNKTVLRRLLKVSIENVVVFSSDGSRFQARGAATENALSPSLRVVRRTK